ncbi:unnamed protein product [Phytophthora fragariaefolia]|uniref:Unnamed protein product n=1 Tax=Phytophthora fragariaefolia TaxID=1490495 RepID=A0A9W6TQX2_9STRA|nr:unnamed protein product [Phytophthora fragariaefolia]
MPETVDAAKKIRDEQLSSSEPLRVENRGAWSMLAKKETPNGTPLPHANGSQSSSLWLSARSMEQIKQQKIQQKEKERTDELEALKRRESEQREKEKERELAERRKQEQEQAAKLAEEKRIREERAREAERLRLAQIAMEREKLARDDDVELHDATLSEDLDAFSSSSFFQAQVNDLHKKFEELNEEVSAALRVQQDAVANASTFGGHAYLTAARKDAIRLAKKTGDWRGDVTALAKHIDLQLQHSRALRSHYAQSLISTSVQKQQVEAEGSRLRCLRSDLRMLQDFRVRHFHQRGEEAPALLSAAEEETVCLCCTANWCETFSFIELCVLRNNSKHSSTRVRRRKKWEESKISQRWRWSSLKCDAKSRVGSPRTLSRIKNNWTVKLGAEELSALVSESRAVSPARMTSEAKPDMTVDDVHFTMQKLKREVAELKSTNSKLLLTNSQLEDDLAHLQTKFEEEKRAHLNGKKLFIPKMQKVLNIGDMSLLLGFAI